MSWATPGTATTGTMATAAMWNVLRDDLTFLYHQKVRKQIDESVTSSTALQNDDELSFAIAAGQDATFRFALIASGLNSGGIQVALTSPSGSTIDYSATSCNGLSGVAAASGTLLGLGATGSNASGLVIIEGSVHNPTNAGVVQLQWSQFASNATSTKVLRGSTYAAFFI